jgi:histidine ammonia-lyase
MRKVEAFQADDGTLHADAESAIRHEAQMKIGETVRKLSQQLMEHGFQVTSDARGIRDTPQMEAAFKSMLRHADSVTLLIQLADMYRTKES